MTVQTLQNGPLARHEVPKELTWDLTTIYKTDADWEADFSLVQSKLPKIASFKGRLGLDNGKILLEAYKLTDQLGEIVGRLNCYANMRLHEDTANGVYQALSQRIETLSSDLNAACAFFTPEVLSIPQSELDAWLINLAELRLYKFRLEELNRQRAHTRSAEVEELLAQVADVCSAPENVYEQFINADLDLPCIQDAANQPIQLTQGNYVARFLQSRNREERQRAFEAMLGTYKRYRNTFGALYAAQVKQDIFNARARRYGSALEAALDDINAPVSVYDSLIDTVHESLPALQRYLQLRKRILGVNELHMYDLYALIVEEVEDKYTWEQAKEIVLSALRPLGSQYVDILKNGVASRWVDVVENKGKRSGAYSWGAYGTHPFMLLNWQNNMDSMFTFAHEAGHSMHSYFTRSTQPYAYGDYTIFVAEVASTCNEALLREHLLATLTDKAVRMLVINDALEGFRTTLFRQTLFAEFEREAHALAEKGEALTPDVLCRIYKGLNEKYYGSSCIIDEAIENEWMRIPHFYSSFYVYQYATGISAATALADRILKEGEPAVKRYLEFLSSGSSDYSINLLRKAGVDLSTPAPIKKAIGVFSHYLDEFERCLG